MVCERWAWWRAESGEWKFLSRRWGSEKRATERCRTVSAPVLAGWTLWKWRNALCSCLLALKGKVNLHVKLALKCNSVSPIYILAIIVDQILHLIRYPFHGRLCSQMICQNTQARAPARCAFMTNSTTLIIFVHYRPLLIICLYHRACAGRLHVLDVLASLPGLTRCSCSTRRAGGT